MARLHKADDEWCLPHEDDSEIIKEYDSASLTALRILERKALPLFHYMEIQECVKNGWASRLRICTKFIQFGTYLRIPLETVHLAVSCLDRFLSVRVISEYHLDLVGAVIFAIAVEFERLSVPSVFELDSSLVERYQPGDIPFIKSVVVEVLDNTLKTPSPFMFLRRISTADTKAAAILSLAQYLSACSLLDARYVGIEPSRIAAAAYHLALRIAFKGSCLELNWSDKHVKLSGYLAVELRPLMAALWNTSQQEQINAPIKAMRVGQFQEAARVVERTSESVFFPRCFNPWEYEGLYIPSWDESTGSSLENVSSSSECSSQGGCEEGI
ncbi:G2/mitotic-specific cyclin [Colletotrichum abscissum]|uniref:G2/mitotic-specific cyclin n=1 Tax=Colletotrichum abscissum TaxID=1671311 RepID=UPI0027D743EC|nr:G2/mitotic-specific cyclin [Colletotrichum abscissum]KAK1521611.1 G2/mitotic-specific cyclin [Colletotrichum abscissum]